MHGCITRPLWGSTISNTGPSCFPCVMLRAMEALYVKETLNYAQLQTAKLQVAVSWLIMFLPEMTPLSLIWTIFTGICANWRTLSLCELIKVSVHPFRDNSRDISPGNQWTSPDIRSYQYLLASRKMYRLYFSFHYYGCATTKRVNALPILCKCLSLLKSNKSVILFGFGWALVYQHMLVCSASYLRIFM